MTRCLGVAAVSVFMVAGVAFAADGLTGPGRRLRSAEGVRLETGRDATRRAGYARRMIVVVGSPAARLDAGHIVADGSSARIAKAVAAAGRSVQIVGRIGDDAAADAVLQDLARASVGHVAILRDPARATPTTGSEPATVGGGPTVSDAPPEIDAADIELALRYLTDFRVVVIVEPATPAVVGVVARAIEWGGARLVVASQTTSDDPSAMALPAGAQVVRPADQETESAFAGRVAALAVTLDPGPLPAG